MGSVIGGHLFDVRQRVSQDFPPQDPLAFVKSLWAQAGLPFPAAMPPIDAATLERKIVEMKAVQGWLQTNLAMLQATIQMMEMQKTGAQAMQEAGPSAQAAGEAWLKILQQYQSGFTAPPADKS